MALTLIATVLALVLGHLAPGLARSVRDHRWFARWLRWLGGRGALAGWWRSGWGVLLALLPPLLLVGLLQALFDDAAWGLGGLLFGVAALFYAWGPRDLDRDVDALVDGDPDPVARRHVAARLSDTGVAPADADALVTAVFRNALRRWFGVLLWFLVLGPVGAIGYRLVALLVAAAAGGRLPAETARGAKVLLRWIEWPVAQLMCLALALVGSFDRVVAAWRGAGGASLQLQPTFLGAAGRAAVASEFAWDGSVPPVPDADPYVGEGGVLRARKAMSLVWRCLLAWLVVLALFVIAGFVS